MIMCGQKISSSQPKSWLVSLSCNYKKVLAKRRSPNESFVRLCRQNILPHITGYAQSFVDIIWDPSVKNFHLQSEHLAGMGLTMMIVL